MDSDLDLELPSDVSSGDLPSDVSSVLVDNNSMEEDLSDQPSPTRVLNLDKLGGLGTQVGGFLGPSGLWHAR